MTLRSKTMETYLEVYPAIQTLYTQLLHCQPPIMCRVGPNYMPIALLSLKVGIGPYNCTTYFIFAGCTLIGKACHEETWEPKLLITLEAMWSPAFPSLINSAFQCSLHYVHVPKQLLFHNTKTTITTNAQWHY
jgi:hypothetical protein